MNVQSSQGSQGAGWKWRGEARPRARRTADILQTLDDHWCLAHLGAEGAVQRRLMRGRRGWERAWLGASVVGASVVGGERGGGRHHAADDSCRVAKLVIEGLEVRQRLIGLVRRPIMLRR